MTASVSKPGITDFVFSDNGSLWLCRPTNQEARQHLEENVSDEAQWFGGALVVEPRYVEGLVEGLVENGYLVS